MFARPLSLAGGRVIKVTIEQLVATQSALGGPSTSWTTVAAGVPVRIQDATGSEAYADQQIEGITHYNVLMRYRKGVDERMRLNFTNDSKAYLFDIENVTNDQFQNRWLILRCKSGVNRG